MLFMLNNQNLPAALLHWDGRHMVYLSGLYDQHAQEDAFFEDLSQLYVQIPSLQKATSWIFKHHYDQKGKLGAAVIYRIYSICDELTDWEAILHVLQLLPHVSLPREQIMVVDLFVRRQANHPKKMVRAWALNGFYALVKYIPENKEEVLFRCEQVLASEVPSVQARARLILKDLKKMK